MLRKQLDVRWWQMNSNPGHHLAVEHMDTKESTTLEVPLKMEALEKSMTTWVSSGRSSTVHPGSVSDVLPLRSYKGRETTRDSESYEGHPMASVAHNGRGQGAYVEKLDIIVDEHEPSDMETDPISQVSVMDKEKEKDSKWVQEEEPKLLNKWASLKSLTASEVDDTESDPISQVSVMEKEKDKDSNWVHEERPEPLNQELSVKSITELYESRDEREEGVQSEATNSTSSLDTVQMNELVASDSVKLTQAGALGTNGKTVSSERYRKFNVVPS